MYHSTDTTTWGGQAVQQGRPQGGAQEPFQELPAPALSLPQVLPALEQRSAASQRSAESQRSRASGNGRIACRWPCLQCSRLQCMQMA